MKIEPLNWDSDFFKLKVGASHLDSTETCELDNLTTYDLVYLFDQSRSFDHKSLVYHNHSVRYSSTTQTYQWDVQSIENQSNRNSDVEILIYKGEPTIELKLLTWLSGTYSRFKLDESFSEEQFKSFYETWLHNSLNGEMADFFIVAKMQDEVVGFVSFKVQADARTGKIGLIAVGEHVQSQGIGQALLNYVKTLSLDLNLKSFTVSTQLENEQACSFYERNGLHLISSVNVHHLWKN